MCGQVGWRGIEHGIWHHGVQLLRQPRYPRLVVDPTRRPVALRPHLSMGLPKSARLCTKPRGKARA
jgi:hypothetical protein